MARSAAPISGGGTRGDQCEVIAALTLIAPGEATAPRWSEAPDDAVLAA
ncbi:hypothetical protein V474_01700 [Novosphingobium barchaimii LL02]|uniref:Uncharacterized protein n=1 Tax=Novosphingobium barchaimii LL02 TaxID=1114963 RepID=A0A0J7YAW8_9SPHN|nr:hypothetical protein [Novosphingobium barchaimii]KMS60458.1 hypothetical protein V474_01700 [Novosphingobium barchaimii LL02]